MIIRNALYLNENNGNISIPNIDYEKMEEDIIDLRKKRYSVDKMEKKEEGNLSLVLQPSLKTENDLETNIFDAYPISDIPFSFSNSWIGM